MTDLSYVIPVLAGLSAKFAASNYKLANVRGIPQNPCFDVAKFEDIIDSFQTRDGDVFVSTFVKAGDLKYFQWPIGAWSTRDAKNIINLVKILFHYTMPYSTASLQNVS